MAELTIEEVLDEVKVEEVEESNEAPMEAEIPAETDISEVMNCDCSSAGIIIAVAGVAALAGAGITLGIEKIREADIPTKAKAWADNKMEAAAERKAEKKQKKEDKKQAKAAAKEAKKASDNKPETERTGKHVAKNGKTAKVESDKKGNKD